jgi:hypothetical protein
MTALERLKLPYAVVCIGSSDLIANRVGQLDDPRVGILHYAWNLGKSHAILHGVNHARASYRVSATAT